MEELDPARSAATYFDQLLADQWTSDPIVAFLPASADPSSVELHRLTPPVEDALAALPRVSASVACVSTLGHLPAQHPHASVDGRVRITLATTSRSTVVVLRHSMGETVVSNACEGAIIDALRECAGQGTVRR